MAKQVGEVKLEGTIGNICFYEMDGKWYARLKSSLTGKRVKKDPRFRRTMEYAGMLTQASRLASVCYQRIPKEERAYPMYRKMVGMAMALLKVGRDVEEIAVELESMAREMLNAEHNTGEIAVVMTDVPEVPVIVVDAVVITDVPEVPVMQADDIVATLIAPLPRLYVNNTGQLVSREFHNDLAPPIQKYLTPHNRITRVLRC